MSYNYHNRLVLLELHYCTIRWSIKIPASSVKTIKWRNFIISATFSTSKGSGRLDLEQEDEPDFLKRVKSGAQLKKSSKASAIETAF